MTCQWLRLVRVGVLLVIPGYFSRLYSQEGPEIPLRAIDRCVTDALPWQVSQLASWPTVKQRSEKIVSAERSRETHYSKKCSISWIRTILDPKWLPEETDRAFDTQTILLEKAHDGLDTTHVEWEKNAYRVRISQTMSVFYVEIKPTSGKIGGFSDPIALFNACRELASSLITDIHDARTLDEKRIAVGGTRPLMLKRSFDTAVITRFVNGMFAQHEGTTGRESDHDLERSRAAFWWYRIEWWTDGRTLGLFTLKTEGRQWVARYGSPRDKYWFSPLPRELRAKGGHD